MHSIQPSPSVSPAPAAKAAPDGYTLVLGQTSNLAINPFLYSKPPFDPLKDFEPVALVSSVPLVVVSSSKASFRNMNDVIKAAKAIPDKVTFASPGNGTVGHLAGEMIARLADVKLLHVPYKGAAPALTDLIGGQVDLYLSVARLNAEVLKALGAPEVRESLTGEGGEVLGGTPGQFAEFLRAEQAKWSKVVKDSGVKLD